MTNLENSAKQYTAQQPIPGERYPDRDEQIQRRVFRDVFEAAAMEGMTHFRISDQGWRAEESWGDIPLRTFSVTVVAWP